MGKAGGSIQMGSEADGLTKLRARCSQTEVGNRGVQSCSEHIVRVDFPKTVRLGVAVFERLASLVLNQATAR